MDGHHIRLGIFQTFRICILPVFFEKRQAIAYVIFIVQFPSGKDNGYEWFYDRVTRCASEPDDEVRSEMLGQLQIENNKEWNCIPLYSDIAYICYNARVKGVNILPNSFIYWNDLDL